MLKCYGMGRCASEPELRHVGDRSSAVAKILVCFRRSYKRGDEWQEENTFINCKAWGKTAERIAQLTKGQPVTMEGRVVQENWTTKEGQKRSAMVFMVDRLCAGNKKEPSPAPAPAPAPTPPPEDSGPGFDDDDTPF